MYKKLEEAIDQAYRDINDTISLGCNCTECTNTIEVTMRDIMLNVFEPVFDEMKEELNDLKRKNDDLAQALIKASDKVYELSENMDDVFWVQKCERLEKKLERIRDIA